VGNPKIFEKYQIYISRKRVCPIIQSRNKEPAPNAGEKQKRGECKGENRLTKKKAKYSSWVRETRKTAGQVPSRAKKAEKPRHPEWKEKREHTIAREMSGRKCRRRKCDESLDKKEPHEKKKKSTCRKSSTSQHVSGKNQHRNQTNTKKKKPANMIRSKRRVWRDFLFHLSQRLKHPTLYKGPPAC